MYKLFVVIIGLFIGCSMAGNTLILDDFEGDLSKKSVDFGSGNNSKVEVSADKEVVHAGKQSLKISYDSVPGGYMWIARGYGLDVPTAAQWSRTPEKVKWNRYKSISFYLYGEGTGALLAVDVKDPKKEIFRFMVSDDTKGWKKVVCPFTQFVSRTDWQPQGATIDRILQFPIMSFQFEVKSPGKGTLYIDTVTLE